MALSLFWMLRRAAATKRPVRPGAHDSDAGDTAVAGEAERPDVRPRGAPQTLLQAGAGLALLLIIALSAVPGDIRPHILANSHCEHFAAYSITGCLLTVASSPRRSLLTSGILLLLFAGALEIVQIWIPGRTADVRDFAASAVGIGVALMLACIGRRFGRWTPVRPLAEIDRIARFSASIALI